MIDKTSEVYKAAVAAQTEVAHATEALGLAFDREERTRVFEEHRPRGTMSEEWREALRAADIEVERKVRY